MAARRQWTRRAYVCVIYTSGLRQSYWKTQGWGQSGHKSHLKADHVADAAMLLMMLLLLLLFLMLMLLLLLFLMLMMMLLLMLMLLMLRMLLLMLLMLSLLLKSWYNAKAHQIFSVAICHEPTHSKDTTTPRNVLE